MTVHQKASAGSAKLSAGIAHHFGAPADLFRPDRFDDWLFLAHLSQARALRVGIEHFRALRGECMGSILWQLNDCWPALSWSVIDSEGRRKPSWYELRRCYAPRLLTVQPVGEQLKLVAVCDGDEGWSHRVKVRRIAFDGTDLAQWECEADIPGQGVAEWAIPASVATPTHRGTELLLAETVGEQAVRAWWFFDRDKDLRLPVPRLDVRLDPASDHRLRVMVTAGSLVRDLCLFSDRLRPDAQVDDMLVTLLPGESHVFVIDGLSDVRAVAARDVSGPPVLRCVGDAPER